MMGPYTPRAGDRVRLVGTVAIVKSKKKKSLGLTDIIDGYDLVVDLDNSSRVNIRHDKINGVISQEIKAGDEVTWWGTIHGTADQGQRMFGTVLFVEDAVSATGGLKDANPGQARAYVKPRGVSSRPQIAVKELMRCGTAAEDADPEPTTAPPTDDGVDH